MSDTDTNTGGHNVRTLQQLLKEAAELGDASGKGADGLTKLLLKTAETSFGGSIDTKKDKHGPGVDDAAEIAGAYIKARSNGSNWEVTGPAVRMMRSRVRLMIKLGHWEMGGAGEPLSTLNALMTLRMKLRREGLGKELMDAPNVILKFAREQLKLDSVIPENELRQFCIKPDRRVRSVAVWWERIVKQAQKLKAGELANVDDRDTSDEIEKLMDVANKRLEDLAKSNVLLSDRRGHDVASQRA